MEKSKRHCDKLALYRFIFVEECNKDVGKFIERLAEDETRKEDKLDELAEAIKRLCLNVTLSKG